MIKSLYVLLWALIAVITFFAAIEISKQLTEELEKRAVTSEFKGWCAVDFKSSKATVDCRNLSKLD